MMEISDSLELWIQSINMKLALRKQTVKKRSQMSDLTLEIPLTSLHNYVILPKHFAFIKWKNILMLLITQRYYFGGHSVHETHLAFISYKI